MNRFLPWRPFQSTGMQGLARSLRAVHVRLVFLDVQLDGAQVDCSGVTLSAYIGMTVSSQPKVR